MLVGLMGRQGSYNLEVKSKNLLEFTTQTKDINPKYCLGNNKRILKSPNVDKINIHPYVLMFKRFTLK